MGILNSAVRGIRQGVRKGKLGKTLSEWFSNSRLNPGSWSEDIARGLGVRTRGKPNWVGGRAARPARNVQGMGGTIHTPATPAVAATGGYRNLTGAGYAAQGVGIAGAGGLGAYMMSGGEEPARKDAQGVDNPAWNEDRAKVIDAFKQKIGGVSAMNESIYQAASKDSQWVKTAIKNMGVERYKQLRKAAMMDPSKAGAVHQQMISALAKSGDTEMMKQAAKDAYVLPGLARNQDGTPRVVVIAPQKDSKTKKTSYTSFQMDWEDEGQQ